MWYKIADGPLDIVGKTLKIVTSLSDTPIIASNWNENEAGVWVLLVREDEPYIRESIYVLNNFSSGAYNTNGTPPLTGIFVSENIRSISIIESEKVHKIDAKYLPSSKHILAIIYGSDSEEQMVDTGYISGESGSEFRMFLIFTNAVPILMPPDMSVDDIILDSNSVQIERVGSTTSDADSSHHSNISPYRDGFKILLPENAVTDTFCITYRELVEDDVYKSSSFILCVNTTENR